MKNKRKTELLKQELIDLHGSEYVEAFETGQSYYRIARLVERFEFPNDADVADFGCGNGMLMDHVAPKVRSYFGVDFSSAFIEKAIERRERLGFENVQLECSSIEDFAKKYPAKFHVGFALDFSEHVPDDQWYEILKAMRLSLVPGAKLYLHTPNRDFFIERMKDMNLFLKQFPEHVAVRNAQDNAECLKKAGFQDISTTFLPHYNILRLLHPLSGIPLIGKFFRARLLISTVVPSSDCPIV